MKRTCLATALAVGVAGAFTVVPSAVVAATSTAVDVTKIDDLTRGWGDHIEAVEAGVLEPTAKAAQRVAAVEQGVAVAPAALQLVLAEARERAELIRESITSEGFTIEDVEVETTTNLVTERARTSVEITTTRWWTEVDRGTGERTEVGDTDVYRVTAPSETSMRAARSAAPELAVSVSMAADDTETATDPTTSVAASSTLRPRTARVEDVETVGSSSTHVKSVAVAAAAASTNFDHEKFAAYGKKWTKKPNNGDKKSDFNPDYPYFKQNCANFVSQMFNQAGWKRTGGVNPNDSSNWDDDLTGPFGATDTWASAAKLYRYAYDKKKLHALGNIWNAVPGNTYFMDWDGNSKINHVTAVTGRTSGGTPRISQKTTNRHNMLLTTWKAKVDQDNPKVKWFGLRRTMR